MASPIEKVAPDVLKKNPSLDFQGASLTSLQIPSKSDDISVPTVDDNVGVVTIPVGVRIPIQLLPDLFYQFND